MKGDDHLVVKIAEEIAAREGVEPEDLQPPLYDVINVDALAQLFHSADHDGSDTEGTVSFTYRDYTVTVTHTGNVRITPVIDDVAADKQTVDTVHG